MTLSRRDLEDGRMRALYVAALDPKRALSDAALAASLAATLGRRPTGAGWWVFATPAMRRFNQVSMDVLTGKWVTRPVARLFNGSMRPGGE